VPPPSVNGEMAVASGVSSTIIELHRRGIGPLRLGR
jgi:hypothetical protein